MERGYVLEWTHDDGVARHLFSASVVAALILCLMPEAAVAHGGEVHEASSGVLRMPPLHPALVHFTIAFIPAAFFSDLMARLYNLPHLRSAALIMLLYAAIATPVAAAAGWWWAASMPMDHWQMQPHRIIGISLALTIPLFAFWRWNLSKRSTPLPAAYFAAFAIILATVLVQGYLGGDMTFMEHKQEMAMPMHHHETSACKGCIMTPNRLPLTPEMSLGRPVTIILRQANTIQVPRRNVTSSALSNANWDVDCGENGFKLGLISLNDFVVKIFHLGSSHGDDQGVTNLVSCRRLP